MLVQGRRWSHLHPALVSVVGSNPWSIYILCCGIKSMIHLHRILGCGIKSMVHLHPLLWDQIHGPFICTTCTWGQIHDTLYLCLFRVKCMVPFTHYCRCIYCGVKSMVLYLCLLWGQMHDHIYTLYLSLFRLKSMVPFTPCTCVNCGVKSMVPFTPCT